MRDCISIGPSPCGESCAQLGKDPDYSKKAKAECIRFVEAIRKKLGDEPEGAYLVVKGFDHDFGRYYEVCVVFDNEKQGAVEYAYLCESKAPATCEDTVPVDRAKLPSECGGCGHSNYACTCKPCPFCHQRPCVCPPEEESRA